MLDPIEDLADLRPVIEEDGVDYSDVMPDATPEERELLRKIVGLAVKLEKLTEWSRNELLDRIGCDHRDAKTLVRDPEKFDRCTRFLQLMLEAAELADTVQAHRQIVQSCARVSKTTQDVYALEALLRSGDTSPLELFGIGEASAAVRNARIAAGAARAGLTVGPSPFDTAPTVHLSVPRVELYVRGERQLLGESIFDRMTEHIDGCSACREVVEHRRARLR